MTPDGFIDHTAAIADNKTHIKALDLLRSVDVVLYGTLPINYWPAARSGVSLSASKKEPNATIIFAV